MVVGTVSFIQFILHRNLHLGSGTPLLVFAQSTLFGIRVFETRYFFNLYSNVARLNF